jgi:hypothetical protein
MRQKYYFPDNYIPENRHESNSIVAVALSQECTDINTSEPLHPANLALKGDYLLSQGAALC